MSNDKGWRVLGYYVHKDRQELWAENVEVVIMDDHEYFQSGKLTFYCPIGQHSNGDMGYLEECLPITKEQYIEASKGFYTPEEYL